MLLKPGGVLNLRNETLRGPVVLDGLVERVFQLRVVLQKRIRPAVVGRPVTILVAAASASSAALLPSGLCATRFGAARTFSRHIHLLQVETVVAASIEAVFTEYGRMVTVQLALVQPVQVYGGG